jgi:hypothetical protein
LPAQCAGDVAVGYLAGEVQPADAVHNLGRGGRTRICR